MFKSLSMMAVILCLIHGGCRKEPTKVEDIKIKSIEVSSTLDVIRSKDFVKENLFDNSLRSWCEGKDGDGIGETIRIKFEKKVVIGGAFIRNGMGDPEYFQLNSRVKDLQVKASDGTAVKAVLLDNNNVQAINFVKPVETDELLFIIDSVYSGKRWKDTCVSEISFDMNKISKIRSFIQACKDEGNFFEFGRCVKSESPIAAVMKKISPQGFFASDCSSLPENCSNRIFFDREKGSFSCGGPPPGTGEGRYPSYSGKCVKMSGMEIECTIHTGFAKGDYVPKFRIYAHEIYNSMTLIDGPYSFSFELNKEFQGM